MYFVDKVVEQVFILQLPKLPDVDGVEVVPTPGDKGPGDLILDKPLSFSVSVGNWEDGKTGNDDGNTNMD